MTAVPPPSSLAPSAPVPPASDKLEDPLGRGNRKGVWHFAPYIGLWQGLINPVLVSIPSVVLKSMGASNAVIGYATLATLPMALKFLLGPMVDSNRTRRWWILRSGEWLMACVALVALSLMPREFSLGLFLGALALVAVVKSVQQIALQGFFSLSLTKSELALFSGLDPVFARSATVVTASILLAVAGAIGSRFGDARITWGLYFGGLILLFALLYFYTGHAFPYPAADRPSEGKGAAHPSLSFAEIVRGYLRLPAIGAGVTYLFFMRSGETFLAKMATPFLMDPPARGGFGLSISEVGLFTGVMTGCAIFGGVISGMLLKRWGLRCVVWPLTLASVIPHFIYVYLALNPSAQYDIVSLNLEILGLGVWRFDWVLLLMLGLENLGYGLGFTVMNYYMFRLAAGTQYPATYIAFSASVIYFSHMIFGAISGIVQEHVGYVWLFILSVVLSVPAFCSIPFLNYKLDERQATK